MEIPKITVEHEFRMWEQAYNYGWDGQIDRILHKRNKVSVKTPFGTFDNVICGSYKRDCLVFGSARTGMTLVTVDGQIINHRSIYTPVYSADYYIYRDESNEVYCQIKGHQCAVPVDAIEDIFEQHIAKNELKDEDEDEDGSSNSYTLYLDDSSLYLDDTSLYLEINIDDTTYFYSAPITVDGIGAFSFISQQEEVSPILFSPYGVPITYTIGYNLEIKTITGHLIYSGYSEYDDEAEFVSSHEMDGGFLITSKSRETMFHYSFQDTYHIDVKDAPALSMQKLYNNRNLVMSDVTINCRGRLIDAHKVVLVAGSDVLEQILTNDRFEHTDQIKVDHSEHIVDLAVRHLYGADFNPKSEDLLDLLILADEWISQSLFNRVAKLVTVDSEFTERAKAYQGVLPPSVLALIEKLLYPYE